MTPETLPQVLREAAVRHRDREAVVDGTTRLSHAELHDRVRLAARALAALGVRPGDRVCVWAPNTWHWVVIGLAVSYAGGVLVPVNTRYTGYEAADVAARTGARAMVAADGFLGRRPAVELRAASRDFAELPELRTIVTAPLGEGDPPDSGRTDPDQPEAGRQVTGGQDSGGHGRAAGHNAAEEAGGPGPRLVDWRRLPELAGRVSEADIEARASAVQPGTPADILFTSGTTGRSKGACSLHRQVVAVARAWADCARMSHRDRYLVINPFFHSFGYKAGIVVCLLTGAALVPQAVFDAARVLHAIESERITVLPGAPTVYQTLLDAPRRGATDTSSLRLAVTGAATVPESLVARMSAELGFRTVLTAYGLSEAVVVTMCRPGDDAALVARTSGRPTAQFEVRVVDPRSGAPAAAGVEGEVLVRGPNVMVGYLDDEPATRAAIDRQGWLHTGDVGRLDPAGYLRITDRLKDVYIVGGFNVYPAEIERALAGLPGVSESAVIGIPDPRLGEVGMAYVVRGPGHALTADDVLAFCRARLANFKVPRVVEFVAALPRNPSGKVRKPELRAAALRTEVDR